MKNLTFINISILFLSSCASPPKLDIRSDIPVRIEKNGTTVCTSTPCTIEAVHWRDGFDLECVRGADTALEAFSLEPNAGIRQSKTVVGICNESTDVYFEMTSGGVVNTVTQPAAEKSITQKLEELNELKKSGLINDAEYNEKRKQVLDSF